MKLYGIIGAGGFAREVMPIAYSMLTARHPQESFQLVFVVEQTTPHDNLNQHPVMTMQDFFTHDASEKFFNIAIANHDARKRIARLMQNQNIQSFSIQALNHLSLANNEIGEGAIFCPFTMVTANAKIGKFFHANIYSYVAHDCVIGDFVTFAPHVQCNGNVIIEDEVYVGTGVIFKQGTLEKPIVIGKGAILGMGAVITKSVSAYETVVGNPARPLQAKQPNSLTTQKG